MLDGKRLPGRPILRYRDNLAADLRTSNIEHVDKDMMDLYGLMCYREEIVVRKTNISNLKVHFFYHKNLLNGFQKNLNMIIRKHSKKLCPKKH